MKYLSICLFLVSIKSKLMHFNVFPAWGHILEKGVSIQRIEKEEIGLSPMTKVPTPTENPKR